jgi:hypothetical protein
MARNRKNQAATVRFGPAAKAFLLCAAIAVSGIGFVWQKQQLAELGTQIHKREVRLGDLRQENDKLRRRLAMLMTPASLEKRIADLKLGLTAPAPGHVWRLPEPPPAQLARPGEQQYASGSELLAGEP